VAIVAQEAKRGHHYRFDEVIGVPAVDKQLAGLSILMTIIWVSVVLLIMYLIAN